MRAAAKPIWQTLGEEWGHEARDARTKAGLTQVALGERIGVAQSVVSDVERGVYPLSVELMVRWAVTLDLEPRELFGWPRRLLDSARIDLKVGAA